MSNYRKSRKAPPRDHADCSGCSLCLLVCPLWRRSRDITRTPHGHAKALQQGVAAQDLSAAVWDCTICRACDPVCPEQIEVSGMILELRGKLTHPQQTALQERMAAQTRRPVVVMREKTALLAGDALRAQPALLNRITQLLAGAPIVAHDDGADIALALEAGMEIPAERLAALVRPLRRADQIIASDGLLLPYLAQWLPNAKILSLGEALSSLAVIRSKLRATDLYVIEPRAYHADYVRLVKHYDRLRRECGCEFNLDLQRIAIPATVRSLSRRLGLVTANGHGENTTLDNGTRHDRFPHPNLLQAWEGANESLREFHDNDDDQARWLLQGRKFDRIVVESLEDRAALEKVSYVPVMHLAELVGDGCIRAS